MERLGDQRLARAGRSREHHVLSGEQLEDRLLLRRVQLDPLRACRPDEA